MIFSRSGMNVQVPAYIMLYNALQKFKDTQLTMANPL